jgi:hypothetical protein
MLKSALVTAIAHGYLLTVGVAALVVWRIVR